MSVRSPSRPTRVALFYETRTIQKGGTLAFQGPSAAEQIAAWVGGHPDVEVEGVVHGLDFGGVSQVSFSYGLLYKEK